MLAGLGTVASMFGKNFSDDVSKVLAVTGGRVLVGSVRAVVAGVTLVWDLYSLATGVTKLVRGGGSQVMMMIMMMIMMMMTMMMTMMMMMMMTFMCSQVATQIRGIADQLEEELLNLLTSPVS